MTDRRRTRPPQHLSPLTGLKGPLGQLHMHELPAPQVLELYYTNHFVGPPRQWVVDNLRKLKEQAAWTGL